MRGQRFSSAEVTVDAFKKQVKRYPLHSGKNAVRIRDCHKFQAIFENERNLAKLKELFMAI